MWCGRSRTSPCTPIHDPARWPGIHPWRFRTPLSGCRGLALRRHASVSAPAFLILPLRNPLVLAKALATLDDFSAGRVEAGVGVGWLEEEFVALGVPFADRGGRTDDYIEAMRAVWATDDASHSGEFARFEGVSVNPKPVARSIPVTIGGHSPAAARRAGRLGDGFFPGRSDPE